MDLSSLVAFAETLKAKFSLPGSASPEDQLKPPVGGLITEAGTSFGLKVESRTEIHLSEHKVRPDIAIYVSGLICGYVELKAPGLGADAPKLKGEHNKKQWEKLKGLPNLIYTDGREWALYRGGERPDGQPIVRLHDDPTDKGKAAATKADADGLEQLFRDFLGWKPIVPHDPSGLARYLAPLSRFLRSEVESALGQSGSAVALLANEWRQFFFPDADNGKFADAYAQTVTYAMLLARLSGAAKLDPADAAKTLDKNNGLLARTLELLGQPEARKELSVGFEMLQRSLEALDPHDFLKSKPDLWLYFYELFLAAYDPKLRKDYGVYYTPREVVELQVRLASELLERRFGKKLGFADDGVVFLDPAVGTGTYLVAAIKDGLEKVAKRSGKPAVPARAKQIAENMHGFEVLVGPYAVAHLRLTQALEGAINDAKEGGEPEEKLGKRLNIYLADTLESPNSIPPGGLDLTHRALTQEHEAARKLKNEGDILVCLGNPPYDRQAIEGGDTATQRKGGWVRFGDQVKGGAKLEDQGGRVIFRDFTEPATKAGAGLHLKNLYNDYIYFWRWALWRLFEQQKCGGIVTFITASSYLAGPGFVGVREFMRRTFDDLWIIDLGGDNLGARKTENIFNITVPVAIAIGVRKSQPSQDTPATVRYYRIEADSRKEKSESAERIFCFADVKWCVCPDSWEGPFLPNGNGNFFVWPLIDQLFPWHLSGVEVGRNWCIAETKELLNSRWQKFVQEPTAKNLSPSRDTGLHSAKSGWSGEALASSLHKLAEKGDSPWSISFTFRSYDLQNVFIDPRLCNWPRPDGQRISSDRQVFFGSLLTEQLANGQAITAASRLPDRNAFHGRSGRFFPLYRDAAGTEPNVTGGLLDTLGKEYGSTPSAEDFAAYVYAVLGGQSYTRRFWNELETPGPRVPLTRDGKTFAKAAKFGRKLIWLHTYAERFRGEDRGEEVSQGKAMTVKGVSSNTAHFPAEYGYDPSKQEIAVGDGRFGPAVPEVWEFEVSGLKVVQSWLSYRMKKRAGKKSSPLDDIRPERWTARMSDDFLELLWVLEATLAMEPALSAILDNVISGACFCAGDLPMPSREERKAPRAAGTAGGLLDLLEEDEAPGEEVARDYSQ
jgi:hypothetical protein